MSQDSTYNLSDTQIQRLVEFTHQKYVKYDDVRIEIVDHLASDIEVQLSDDRELSFEQALKNTYGKFPITGFAQFIDARADALKKYWRRKILSLFVSYLTLPKILLTASIAMFIWLIKVYYPTSPLHYLVPLLIIITLEIQFSITRKTENKSKLLTLSILKPYTMLNYWKFRKKEEKPHHLLFMTIFKQYLGLCFSAFAYISVIMLKDFPVEGWGLILYCSILSFLAIFYFAIISGDLTDLLINEFETKYSEVNMDLYELNLDYWNEYY